MIAHSVFWFIGFKTTITWGVYYTSPFFLFYIKIIRFNMPFEKGHSKAKGRPRGSVNKSTQQIRDAYHKLLEDNLENMSTWLADVAEGDPKQALDLMLKLSEYMIPKLARQEIVGNDGEDLFKNITLQFGDWKEQ